MTHDPYLGTDAEGIILSLRERAEIAEQENMALRRHIAELETSAGVQAMRSQEQRLERLEADNAALRQAISTYIVTKDETGVPTESASTSDMIRLIRVLRKVTP